MEAALLFRKKAAKSDKLVDYAPVDVASSITVKDRGSLGLNLARITGSTADVYQHPTFGRCMRFMGTAGLVSAGTVFGGAKIYTINLDYMVNARSDAVLITHVSWSSGGASFGIMSLSDGRLQLYFNGGQRVWSTAIALNVATNVRIVVNNTSISLYVNGTLVGSYTGSARTEPAYGIGVGSASEGAYGVFNGFIKNIWIKEGIVLP